MQPIYRQEFVVNEQAADAFGRLKPSAILTYMQEVAANHFRLLEDPSATLESKNLFWAVSRHRVEILRLPQLGQTVTVETWPMPTTRVAYPRATAIYDAEGTLLVRTVSLWVLMDRESRAMVLPGKSGVTVEGILRGNEPELPKSLSGAEPTDRCCREVTAAVLDQNGHMNNARYLDWVCQLLANDYLRQHTMQDLAIFYHAEALEGQQIDLHWSLSAEGALQVEAYRNQAETTEKLQRVFSAQASFAL